MPLTLPSLDAQSRLLFEIVLRPLQGQRLQPTGFPNLGAAEFTLPSGRTALLVESAQSMANRLESVIWDDAANDLVEPLRGMPYVRTSIDGTTTDSIREAHRLNSPYLAAIHPQIRDLAAIKTDGPNAVDRRKLAAAVFRYDPNSIIHGIFLEKITGQARLTRALSAFIEATGVDLVNSGGVKNDRVDTTGKLGGGAAAGFGNVPFSRTEYTAERIVAYFSLDATLLRSYGLGEIAEHFLIALTMYKIALLLEHGLRLRTACDLSPVPEESRTNLSGFGAVPTSSEVEPDLRTALDACRTAGLFVEPPITDVAFDFKAKKK